MQLDEFESRFKRASKELFEYREVRYKRLMFISDLPRAEAEEVRETLQRELRGIEADSEWYVMAEGDFDRAMTLMEKVDEFKPDLIVTYRNLRHREHEQRYTLGIYVDVLTQATLVPVLIIPYPRSDRFKESLEREHRILVLTDHVQGDDRLIDSALPFAGEDGALFLAHVEDEVMFERYMREIEKVPAIPTDVVREELSKMLVKEPSDYIESARAVLKERFPKLQVDSVVEFGLANKTCKRLLAEQEVGLVVVNTKDENQLAMHGDAYAIAVEIRTVPLLLL